MSGVRWARPFHATTHDGQSVHGVEFPSGRCVLDGSAGLIEAAIILKELTVIRQLSVVFAEDVAQTAEYEARRAGADREQARWAARAGGEE